MPLDPQGWYTLYASVLCTLKYTTPGKTYLHPKNTVIYLESAPANTSSYIVRTSCVGQS